MDPKDLQSRIFINTSDNFEVQKYYQNEPRINGFYFRDNLPDKIKAGAYLINLDEYSNIRTRWTALYALNNNVSYFDSFDVENISKEIKKFTENKNLQTNIFKIQAYNSVLCGYFLLHLWILCLMVKA